MKKMLVTGGCGFIGSAFIRYVLQSSNNFEILNLDILNYAANLENLKQFDPLDPAKYDFAMFGYGVNENKLQEHSIYAKV